MRSAMARHNEILSTAVSRHGGTVFNWLGDGIAAAFPSAAEALRAAADIQRELAALDTADIDRLSVRVGVHSGEVEQRDGDFLGAAVNRAARIMSTGHGGQVLVSEVTARLAPPGEFHLVDLGHHRLRDLGHPENIHQLVVPGLDSTFPPLRSLSQDRNNLPVQLTSFVGREDEIAQVLDLMANHRLVTITGVGGVGKTRVALQAAGEIVSSGSSEARFIALAPVAGADGVPVAFLEGLGMPTAGGGDVRSTLLRHLRDSDALLVIDNCEHLIDATARLVSEILTSAPGVSILATSRELLGVPGEVAFGLRSLSVPDRAEQIDESDAGRLLLDRAQQARPELQPTEHREALIDICRRLDGVPLAIELAAARLRTFSPEKVAGLLEEGFRLLTGGSRTAVPRQRTLEAAIEWSHRLLDESEREVFRRLAVFSGGFTLDAAQAVCAMGEVDAISVVDLVSALVDKSLVSLIDDSEDRFRLLETVRQFASSRLEEAAEADLLRERHARYFRDLVVECVEQRWGAEAPEARRRVQMERDNLRQALTWSIDAREGEIAFDLAVGFEVFAYVGEWNEPVDWLERAVAALGEPPDEISHAIRLGRLASAVSRGPDQERAIELWKEAIAIFTGEDDGGAEHDWLVEYILARYGLAVTSYYAGGGGHRNELFRADIRKALAIAERIDHRTLIAILLGNLAHHVDPDSDPAEARRAFARAEAAQKSVGDPSRLASLFWQRARYEFFVGDLETASEYWHRAIAEAEAVARQDILPRFKIGLALNDLVSGDSSASARIRLAVRETIDQTDDLGSHRAGAVSQSILVALASADASEDEWERVAIAAGASSAEADRGTPVPWDLAPHFARTLDAARAALDAEEFAAAEERGRGMSHAEVTTLLAAPPPGE